MTCRDQGQVRDTNTLIAKYFENGWK